MDRLPWVWCEGDLLHSFFASCFTTASTQRAFWQSAASVKPMLCLYAIVQLKTECISCFWCQWVGATCSTLIGVKSEGRERAGEMDGGRERWCWGWGGGITEGEESIVCSGKSQRTTLSTSVRSGASLWCVWRDGHVHAWNKMLQRQIILVMLLMANAYNQPKEDTTRRLSNLLTWTLTMKMFGALCKTCKSHKPILFPLKHRKPIQYLNYD